MHNQDSVYTILEYYQAHWWKARDAMGYVSLTLFAFVSMWHNI